MTNTADLEAARLLLARLARTMNRVSAIQFATGLLTRTSWVTLDVPGRATGRIISLPLVVADYHGDRYRVSMLGKNANWVRNVHAAGGRVVLRHDLREVVYLEEIEVGARAPILRRYLNCAPGARAHVPVDRHAPLAEFDRIAGHFPVFRISVPQYTDSQGSTRSRYPRRSSGRSGATARRSR